MYFIKGRFIFGPFHAETKSTVRPVSLHSKSCLITQRRAQARFPVSLNWETNTHQRATEITRKGVPGPPRHEPDPTSATQSACLCPPLRTPVSALLPLGRHSGGPDCLSAPSSPRPPAIHLMPSRLPPGGALRRAELPLLSLQLTSSTPPAQSPGASRPGASTRTQCRSLRYVHWKWIGLVSGTAAAPAAWHATWTGPGSLGAEKKSP